MKLTAILLALLACPVATGSLAFAQAARGKAARTVTLTGDDKLHYSLTTISATPGERLRIVLQNVGTMPKAVMGHNVVVLRLGADPVAFTQAGLQARETEFIPPAMKDQVLAATPLSGPGETVEATFTVPAGAGSYTYLCSFPGHYAAGMRGTLVVK